MTQNLEFILTAINKVARTDRSEGLEKSQMIVISGVKKGFLKSENIILTIERSQKDPLFAAFVTAKINQRVCSDDVSKELLFEWLEASEMLDARLNLKLGLLFNDKKIKTESGNVIVEDSKENSSNHELYHSEVKVNDSDDHINPMAIAPLLGYRTHLAGSWPELKDKIEIGFIRGTNGSEICFSHSLGNESEEWLTFVTYGICLPIALENCIKYGITTFAFYSDGEIETVDPKDFLNIRK